ncbi:MAG: acyl carrier protein [Planctomycetes bacterium]|nr:acyl carrier protein [Planctomycetota bacterium]
MAPHPETLRTELLALFNQDLNLAVEHAETDLLEQGILDSLTFVELLFRLEQRYGVRADLETLDTEKFRTVARIAAFLEEEIRAGRARTAS